MTAKPAKEKPKRVAGKLEADATKREAFRLVLLRHGESQWNLENRFTGWVDIGLSEKGMQESKNAAAMLKAKKFSFDIAFTSVLKRAVQTTGIILKELGQEGIPVVQSWRLNERHYGALQGMNKDEMRKKYGEEQVFIWRRSYLVRPPELTREEALKLVDLAKYAGINGGEIPLCESLEDTVKRVLPCWEKEIAPAVISGKMVLVSAHGNSLRALIKHIDSVSDEEIPKIEIPTGKPLVYEFDSKLKPVRHYYLG